ncbi:MAG: hypothetical protein WD824_15150 [Cyclobacteriaceae bacterium]
MKLFRKIKKEDNPGEGKSTGILEILYTAILKSQRKLADWLGTQSEKLSPQGKKISLLLFGLLMGGISLMLVINSFKVTSVNASVFPHAIESPAVTPGIGTELIMTPEEYAKLIRFRRMMDSLKQSPEGRTLYNEILQGRAGLLDSFDFLLSIYADQD